ncbi:MAG: relaxase domain-containing protein [Actinobacteria bacterium]|nr:relaxase domain-containing protein [Actinomycetota bacterium]
MLTIRKIRVAAGDWSAARRAAEYALGARESPETVAAGIDAARGEEAALDRTAAPTAIWLGSATMLSQLGVERGEPLTVKGVGRSLQGRSAKSGVRLRREGRLSLDELDEQRRPIYDEQGRRRKVRVAGTKSVDLTFSAPKSVSVLWSQADPELRAEIEAAMMAAADAVLENMTMSKPVVAHRRSLWPAAGFAAAASLHVVARAARRAPVPAPQLHVHGLVVGVERADGYFASPELSRMFKYGAPLEGGAVGRAKLAERLVDLGFEIEQRDRFFEVAGVPAGLLEEMSARSREVEAGIREREREWGRELSNRQRAAVAMETRLPKGQEPALERTVGAWAEVATRHGFDRGRIAELRRGGGFAGALDQRLAAVVSSASRRQRAIRGKVTEAEARALVLECAAGLLRLEETRGSGLAVAA